MFCFNNRFVLIKYARRGLVEDKFGNGGLRLFKILFWISVFFFCLVVQMNQTVYFFKKGEHLHEKTYRSGSMELKLKLYTPKLNLHM